MLLHRLLLPSANRVATASQQHLQRYSAAAAEGHKREPTIKKEWHADGKIARLILNNPSRRNPLSLGLLTLLHEELLALNANQTARAIILAAAGENVYSAGHDLKELTTEAGARQHQKVFGKCIELMEAIQQIQLPVIAEVDGLVTAAGSQLVASCDIVVATRRSTFSCPGVKIGLFCNTPGIALARNLPRKLLLDMLLTSRAIDAQEAQQAGLVSRVVDDGQGQAQAEAMRVAEAICQASRPVCALGKTFFYAQVERSVNTANRSHA